MIVQADLHHLPDHFYRYLQTEGKLRTLLPGTALWQPGDKVDTLYYVESGLVRLLALRSDAQETTVLAVGVGGVLGVHPLLGEPKRLLEAEAVLPTQLRGLAISACKAWLKAQDSTEAALQAWFTEDLRRHLDATYVRLALAHAPAPERLARVLLSLNAAGLLRACGRKELAELANVSTETGVRILRSWVDEGTLTSRNRHKLSPSERHNLTDLLGHARPLTLPYS